MNKREAEKAFKEEYEWFLKETKDKPYKQLMWNDFTEHLYQSDQITEKQLYTWDQPNFVKK